MSDLTTLSYVKVHLGITASTDDTVLAQLISACSGLIETLTGRSFINTDYTEIVDGNGVEHLTLVHYPINSVASLSYNEGTTGTPLWTAVDADSWTFYPEQGTLYCSSGFRYGSRLYKVVYNAGLGTTATMPKMIQTACAEMVGFFYNRKGKQGEGGFKTGSYSVDLKETDIEKIPTLQTFIQKYRVHYV